MEVQKDFKQLLELFNTHDIAYVIVGAYALAFHGYPRYTGDLDILIKSDLINANKIISALKEFGFKTLKLVPKDFIGPKKVIQLGVPPVRIDILTSLTGVTWKQISLHRQKGKFGDLDTYFIGRKEFVANKKALGRHKDLADIESISKIKNI